MKPSKKTDLLSRITFVCAALAALSPLSHADVASLREKGPKSGAFFSNPGLSELSADVKIAMRDAQVTILLKKGDSNTLLAECEANFLLENIAPTETGPQDYLVAFPVTGLRSKIVTVKNFAVTVDGKTPPTVFRQAIAISRRQSKLQDTEIAGRLDARFSLEKSEHPWGTILSDKSHYSSSYIWSQHTEPGTKTKVTVKYEVALLPQTIQYSKAYTESPDDREVIPFDILQVDASKGSYYFFDYILLSGSTWEGPIGHETIELKISPELQLNAVAIRLLERNAVGYHQRSNKKPEYMELEDGFKDDSVTVQLKNEKPSSDLLFAIPASAIGQKGQ